MPGIRRQEERTAGNGRLQGLSYRRGKDPVRGSPQNERGVCNVCQVWGKRRFPFRDLVQLGIHGFEEAGLEAQAVNPFHDHRRNQGVVVNDFLQNQFDGPSAGYPTSQFRQPEWRPVRDEPPGSRRLHVVEEVGGKSPDEHEARDAVRMFQAHAHGDAGAHGTADQRGLLNVEGIHKRAEGIEEKGRRILTFGFL